MPTLVNASPKSDTFLDQSDGQGSVLWKSPRNERGFYYVLENEFRICQSLSFVGVRRSVKKGLYQNVDSFGYSYIHGKPIEETFSEKGMDVDSFLDVAIKILAILEKVHEQGICHQSITPTNILYNEEARTVHLIDFAFAGEADEATDLELSSKSEDLSFIAPERFGGPGGNIDQRADLYSLGCLFFNMLSGTKPYQGTSASAVIDQIISKKVDIERDDVPDLLKDIIQRLMQRDPSKRYQGCYSLWYDLKQIQEKITSDQSLDQIEQKLSFPPWKVSLLQQQIFHHPLGYLSYL